MILSDYLAIIEKLRANNSSHEVYKFENWRFGSRNEIFVPENRNQSRLALKSDDFSSRWTFARLYEGNLFVAKKHHLPFAIIEIVDSSDWLLNPFRFQYGQVPYYGRVIVENSATSDVTCSSAWLHVECVKMRRLSLVALTVKRTSQLIFSDAVYKLFFFKFPLNIKIFTSMTFKLIAKYRYVLDFILQLQ